MVVGLVIMLCFIALACLVGLIILIGVIGLISLFIYVGLISINTSLILALIAGRITGIGDGVIAFQ